MKNAFVFLMSVLLLSSASYADMTPLLEEVRKQAKPEYPLELTFVQVEKGLRDSGYVLKSEKVDWIGKEPLNHIFTAVVQWRREKDGLGMTIHLVIKQRAANVAPFLTNVELLPQQIIE